MKKIISTVAALGLVAGFAATASAMDFSMTGKYVLEGYMLNNADGLGFNPYSDEAGTDSAWVQTFLVKPTLKVNDKITMFSEIRFAKDSDWGDDAADGGPGMGDHRGVDIYHIYMEYMSPVGKLRMGRTPAGSWGSDFMSTSTTANRFMWWPSFVAEPFSLCLFTQKTVENDWDNNNDDNDSDMYEIDLTYKVDNMNLRAAYDFINDKTQSDVETALGSLYDRQHNRLKLNADMQFGPVSVLSEYGWQFGDFRDYDTEVAGLEEDRDVDAMAFMLDVSTKMDKLDIGLLYFWAEGQDELDDADDDMTAAMNGALDNGIGDDFNPYYILTGDHTGMLNSDEYDADPFMVQGGVHAIGIHTDFAVSDQLSLHGAVAYALVDEESGVEQMLLQQGLGAVSVDDEYGWEIDLGAKYKLLDNLTYELRGAYFNTGDFFEDIAEAAGQDADDLYLVSHHLTMTF
ncbi:MAG: hypothetical protein BM485_17820 [Desulfobulbaceae bacterium DB1]|nr:MAG: hypothetical protein BM485_17820 [Desulfobulbaceae bacterium DB1]